MERTITTVDLTTLDMAELKDRENAIEQAILALPTDEGPEYDRLAAAFDACEAEYERRIPPMPCVQCGADLVYVPPDAAGLICADCFQIAQYAGLPPLTEAERDAGARRDETRQDRLG